MNERIRELAEQANPSFKQFYITGPWHSVDIEKFAELIVRECVVTTLKTHDAEPLDDWDYGYNAGVYAVADAIREHFGVEE